MQVSINSLTLLSYQCGGVALSLICLIAVRVDIQLGQIRSLRAGSYRSAARQSRDLGRKKRTQLSAINMRSPLTCLTALLNHTTRINYSKC